MAAKKKAKDEREFKAMSTREYADLRGISIQAVSQAIKRKHNLPGVTEHYRSSRYYVVVCDMKALKKYIASQKAK